MAKLTKAQRATIAELVRALHSAQSNHKPGNPYLIHAKALKSAAHLLSDMPGDESFACWMDWVGPDCTGL